MKTLFSAPISQKNRAGRALPGCEPSPGKARAARVNALSLKEKEALGLGKLVFAKFASLVYVRLVNVCLRKPVNKPPVYEIVYERRLNKLVYENCHEVYKHSQTRSDFANVCEKFAKLGLQTKKKV